MRCSVCGRERSGQILNNTGKYVQRPDGQWSLVYEQQYCLDNEDCKKAVGHESEPDAARP